MSEEDWYRKAFEAHYLDVYSHRDDASARDEVRWIDKELRKHLPAHPLVLDVGCGAGRHALAWIEGGASVLGVDLSQDLIDHARQRGLANAFFKTGDMRALGFDGHFDLVTSLFTSFGYFESPKEDLLVIDGVARALKTNGLYVFDFLNAPLIKSQLVPESHREVGEYQIHETRRLIDGESRVQKDVHIIKPEGSDVRYRESVRLWQKKDIIDAFLDRGLTVFDDFGDFGGADYTPSSPRLILFAKKTFS